MEPFKNAFNPSVVATMAMHFHRHYPEFDQNGFISAATKNLETLELKARSEQISTAMEAYLPADFTLAADIILASLRPVNGEDLFGLITDEAGIVGWAVLPLNDYVGRCGLQHHALSMTLLKEMTTRFTSEFGIRFFLLSATTETLAILQKWVTDPNHHVRRLISEGTRTRLPWAMQLPMFIENPQPVIALLEQLKDDPEEYVRRSVANNLNDIAKDHPDLVADISLAWMEEASPNRKKLIQHACRTLLKQGHKKALHVFGFSEPMLQKSSIAVATPSVIMGEELTFSLALSSTASSKQALMIDYIVHHQKKNGSTSPKVFKWKKLTLSAGETVLLSKQHSFKTVTTRVYYAGIHAVEVVVNGVSIAKTEFELNASS